MNKQINSIKIDNVQLFTVEEMIRFIITSEPGNINILNNIEDYLFENCKNYTKNELNKLFLILKVRRKRTLEGI